MNRCISRFIILLISVALLNTDCFAQQKGFWNLIVSIDTDKVLNNQQKISALYNIQKKIQTAGFTKDTVYVFVLMKIADYEYEVNDNIGLAINNNLNALNLNKALKTKSSSQLIVKACQNLASIYDKQLLYKQALNYYDNVIINCKYFNNYIDAETEALERRVNVFFRTGDYQKAIEESSIGINLSLQQKDTAHYIYFLNRKAQSAFFQGNLDEALHGAIDAIAIAGKKDTFELATAYKILGLTYEKKKLFDSALYFYKACVKNRILTKKSFQIASDYNDLANFYLNSLQEYTTANYYYNSALKYAGKMDDSLAMLLKKAMIYSNLGENSFNQNNISKSASFYILGFKNLGIDLHNSILNTPTLAQLANVMNKDLVIVLMDNATRLLLCKFTETNKKIYLTACINYALVTDSIITKLRHEIIGEKSKLYWRNRTQGFFSHAMEACYLAKNPSLAFYFMEQNRSVLLNDKLNELNASSTLPPKIILQQGALQKRIARLQQQQSSLSPNSNDYKQIQTQLLNYRKDYDRFIASLEKNYPVYYQYKYDDKAPTLKELQEYLAKHNQSFADYFIGDTASYILSVTGENVKFIRLPQKELDKNKLVSFSNMFSDKTYLNTHYNSFAQTSCSIYKTIFQKLGLPKGRVIICSENIVLPFEALCTDVSGKNFLLTDYSFDYVYSARTLMKQFKSKPAKGEFAGFAPVSFSVYLHVNNLLRSEAALKASASYYENENIFINAKASKNNFFKYAPLYSVLSIFSHASADTIGNEPLLFMQDSLIYLSELQQINNTATQLVLLSACETNVGKAATGEGIYSLARGFATAGIPSVAATLWKADEDAIYTISEKFNEYLSEGMNKDEALQKAKIYFINKNKSSEKLLPYYWANMILIGNADAVGLNHNNKYWWLTAISLVACVSLFIYFIRFKKSTRP